MITDIIKNRHSVRTYRPNPIPDENVTTLNNLIEECNDKGDIMMRLVTDEPDSFGKSMLARYGKFSNVCNYIALIGPKDHATKRKIGYYGETVVLKAAELGLNTCWVGMTFRKREVEATVPQGMKIHAVIAIGYGENNGAPHKIKTPQQVAPGYNDAPDWFKHGVECALLAPSALNQQKFKFSHLGDNRVKASAGFGSYTTIDLGIAMRHFELGAGIDIDWAL